MLLHNLLSDFNPQLNLKAVPNPQITGLAEDSRIVQPGDLFIARAGTQPEGTKFIGHAIVIGVFVINPVLYNFGWQNTLYLFGWVPAYTYSDMNGYGHFVPVLLWSAARAMKEAGHADLVVHKPADIETLLKYRYAPVQRYRAS